MTGRHHQATIWARDLRRTRWAWSCTCGARYTADLPNINTARSDARTHVVSAITR